MTADSVGARLREARTNHKLSLRSVAQALGVSASLISQVETGKTQPSVSTLYALANHLGLSLDDLLGVIPPASGRRAPEPDRVRQTHWKIQRAADNPVLEMENGVRWERLASGVGHTAEALLVTYEPGATSSIEGKLMRHSGIESAYILEGQLTLQLEFDVHVTADDVPVVMHDPSVMRTTAGQGAIATMSWRQLRELDAEARVISRQIFSEVYQQA